LAVGEIAARERFGPIALDCEQLPRMLRAMREDIDEDIGG
jgi:hypothetical protein